MEVSLSTEGGGDQLPIWPMDIVASARPSYLRRVTGVYIISMMDDTKPTRSSLSSRKEGTASPHWASGLWNGSPRFLGGLGQSPTRFLPRFPSGPLSSSAPDCLSSSLKEYRAPHGAVVLSSQLAIPVEGRAGTSLPVGQLSRAFLLDPMLDQWLHGRKSRKCFLRPFHSAFKAASRLQDDASVFRLVYLGCPRSCLMAHSDRGHPSVRSPGPVVLVCHKAKARGVSAARSSRHPLPLHG